MARTPRIGAGDGTPKGGLGIVGNLIAAAIALVVILLVVQWIVGAIVGLFKLMLLVVVVVGGLWLLGTIAARRSR